MLEIPRQVQEILRQSKLNPLLDKHPVVNFSHPSLKKIHRRPSRDIKSRVLLLNSKDDRCHARCHAWARTGQGSTLGCCNSDSVKVWKYENINEWKYERVKVWKYKRMKEWKYERVKVWKYKRVKVWTYESVVMLELAQDREAFSLAAALANISFEHL